jgi:putative tricarboxylic transport membrane protein
MNMFDGLLYGFQNILINQPTSLFYCFVGVFVGTLIGVLPGIGPIGTMSILLPFSFGISPVCAVIMLAGIYYGAQYGGSTTSILVNIPGESSSVVTCLDGYQMARQGRAGPALGIAAFGSFIGGTISVIILMFVVRSAASYALKFGPPEYFSLMCLGLTIVTYLAKGSALKAIVMAVFGLILSTVGIDLVSGKPRFSFGSATLLDGIGIIPLAMGLFGIAELLTNIEEGLQLSLYKSRVKNLLPNLKDWKRSISPILRGTAVGFPLGLIPGGGAIIASFASYSVEKMISQHPEEFGKGAIEGVAGPETANNAGAMGTFVPLMALGIPTTVSMGLLMGALVIHGITPGPAMINDHPEIFWGIIVSMYLGNVMLLILNLPLIGIWIQVLKVPYRILVPLIFIFCIIGAYSLNSNVFDVLIMFVFGIVGYILRKFDYEEAPLMLAFILGPMMESAFRQSLIMSGGRFSIFFTRPIAGVCLAVTMLLFLTTGFSYYRKAKEKMMD